jgi:thiamine-phosphate pyrophosphorylase
MEACHANYEYAFLSPVFDSISKADYRGKYDLRELKVILRKKEEKIIALGGVDEDKIDALKDAGFAGIALLGAIWQSDEPIDKFRLVRKKWLAKELVY